ncbi:hypothetical protein [Olivibacter sp. XZL3]|uniref:hypothetical protein n=1 Tax=Olivibacter sp. XZL3 TaxID=1735116 RepID=UPI0010647370|nr:hypothetical protein [Olivibacter sp. XZL3]
MNRFLMLAALLLGWGIVAVFYFLLKPVEVAEGNATQIQSVVTNVDKGGLGDYIVELEDKSGMYFISKRYTKNLNIDSLAEKLNGQAVSVTFLKPNALSRFGPMITKKQRTKLEVNKQTVFSAI